MNGRDNIHPCPRGGNSAKGATYNEKQIAWELERTALGDGFYGNALRVAKDMPGVTADDRVLLDRFATGMSRATDHVALQDLAMRIYAAPQAPPVEWFVQWIRNNYQDHPNIASLCDAMLAAAKGE